MRPKFAPVHIAEFALLGVVTLIYLTTLDNGLQPHELLGGDLITHHFAQVEARPANAPGYPIYTAGGWLWFHTIRSIYLLAGAAYPNPIPILSAYSLIWAVAAIWLLYRIICRLTVSNIKPAGNWPVAWLLSLFFAVTYFFWYYATTSEQYSSAVAQTLAIIYVYLIWAGRTGATPATNNPPTGDNRWLYWLAFLCGLSLAHMLTVAFIVPPLVLVLLWQAPGLLRSPKAIAGAVFAAALPLLGYVYVYVRGASNPQWWGEGTWESGRDWFWDFVGTSQGWQELGWGLESDAPFFGNGFPEFIWQELTLPLLMIGLIGIAFLPKRTAIMLYSTLAIYIVFCWVYRMGNWFQVILPAYPLVLIGVAAAIDHVSHWLQTAQSMTPARTRRTQRMLQTATLALLAVAVVWRIQASLPEANSRNRPNDTALDRAAILLNQPIPAHAALFAQVDDALALHYLTRIWGIRPDLSVTGSDHAADLLIQGQPVLATWESASLLRQELPDELPSYTTALSPDWMLFSIGPISPSATMFAGPSPLSNANDQYAHQPITRIESQLYAPIRLYGYAIRLAPTATPIHNATTPNRTIAGADVTLYWELQDQAWPADVRISLRPRSHTGYLAIHDSTSPQAEEADGQDAFLKIDRNGPAPLALGFPSPSTPHPSATNNATADMPNLVADPYRIHLTAEQMRALTHLEILLYRPHNGGFQDLAAIQLPIETEHFSSQ